MWLLRGCEKCFDCSAVWLLGCSRWLFTGPRVHPQVSEIFRSLDVTFQFPLLNVSIMFKNNKCLKKV